MKRRTLLAGLGLMPLIGAARTLPDLEALAERNRQRHRERLHALASSRPAAVYANPADPALGPARAARTVIYFTDFNCPYCRKLDAVLERVARERPTVRFVFKPLALIDDSSAPAARYALAVWQDAPARYWAVHHALMQVAGPLAPATLARVAADTGTTRALPGEPRATQALAANQALADQLQLFSTPVLLIGERLYAGLTDAETLKRALDALS